MKIDVIGGGIAGLVSALKLVRAGHAVTLFEQGTVGCGASGKALGVLVPSGLKRPVDELQRAGIAAWPGLLASMGREDVLRVWGERYQVRLPELFGALKEAIEREGGVVCEGVAGRVREEAEGVLWAAGWGNTAVGIALKISAGQVVRCALAEGKMLARLVTEDNLFVAPDWDGTVLVGSHNSPLPCPGDGVADAAVSAQLLARAVRVAPELEGAEIVADWVGYRPVSDPRLPLVRKVGEKAYAVAGLGKVGIGLAPVVGDAAVEVFGGGERGG